MLVARAGQSLTGAASFRRLADHSRSIHIPRRIIPPSNAANLVHRTRTLITRIISHLHAPPISRAVQSSSIRQSLSLPVRIALSRPLRAPCLPRAPRVPGNVTQVGLGTARNFSSGRPIFQHIVENVPVAGRAFYEVDWELKMREEKNSRVRRPKKAGRRVKLADKLVLTPEPIAASATASREDEEIQHYFSTPSIPPTTTYLQIPLAPTPTSRVPLSSLPTSPRLLPLSALAKEHVSHSKHAIRVSSLFRRLDAAQVWERGASCETLGDPSGLCTILRVRFEGWTEDMVRRVLGDAGKGWCSVQELPWAPDAYNGSRESLLSAASHAVPSERISSTGNELPSNPSFVMPTLDFSSSFLSADSLPTPWPEEPSNPTSLSDGESDYSFPSAPGSVWGEDSVPDVNEWSSGGPSSPGQSWLNFSSDFERRASYYQSDSL